MAGRRRQAVRGLIGLFVGFGTALGTIAAIDRFDEDDLRREPLGRLDYEAYCAREDGMTAMLLVSDANGWRCAGASAGVPRVVDIDPSVVCAWQYGDDAQAMLFDPYDTLGWSCVAGG